MRFTDLSAYCVLWVPLIWVFGQIGVDQHDTTILSRAEMPSIPGEEATIEPFR